MLPRNFLSCSCHPQAEGRHLFLESVASACLPDGTPPPSSSPVLFPQRDLEALARPALPLPCFRLPFAKDWEAGQPLDKHESTPTHPFRALGGGLAWGGSQEASLAWTVTLVVQHSSEADWRRSDKSGGFCMQGLSAATIGGGTHGKSYHVCKPLRFATQTMRRVTNKFNNNNANFQYFPLIEKGRQSLFLPYFASLPPA